MHNFLKGGRQELLYTCRTGLLFPLFLLPSSLASIIDRRLHEDILKNAEIIERRLHEENAKIIERRLHAEILERRRHEEILKNAALWIKNQLSSLTLLRTEKTCRTPCSTVRQDVLWLGSNGVPKTLGTLAIQLLQQDVVASSFN